MQRSCDRRQNINYHCDEHLSIHVLRKQKCNEKNIDKDSSVLMRNEVLLSAFFLPLVRLRGGQ